MTDSALLQMAKIVAELARVTYDWKDARCVIAEQLVRDLEAAPPPEPARRTITREEFNAARVVFLDEHMTSSEVMTEVAAAWRLTVEDA